MVLNKFCTFYYLQFNETTGNEDASHMLGINNAKDGTQFVVTSNSGPGSNFPPTLPVEALTVQPPDESKVSVKFVLLENRAGFYDKL